jgi:hypothetical protein
VADEIEMKERLLDMISEGVSYANAGAKFGLTRGMVAGIIYRHRYPDAQRERRVMDSAKELWTEARLTEKWEHRKLRRVRERQHA